MQPVGLPGILGIRPAYASATFRLNRVNGVRACGVAVGLTSGGRNPDSRTTAAPRSPRIQLNRNDLAAQVAIVAVAAVVCRALLAAVTDRRDERSAADEKYGFEWRFARYCQALLTVLNEHPHKSPHSGRGSDSFGVLESL